jgi:hypothetical protein
MAAAAAMISRKHRNASFGQYRSSRSYYDDDHDGPNMCWLTIFGIVGVILIGTGAWYGWDSYEDPRIVAIQPYNTVVDLWNTRDRAKFAGTVFEWRLISPQKDMVTIKGDCTDEAGTIPAGCTKTHQEAQYKDVDAAAAAAVPWVAMQQAVIAEPLSSDQNMKGINSYEPLRYVGKAVLPESLPGQLTNLDDGHGVHWTGHMYKLQLRARKDGKETIFDIEPIEPMKETPVAANVKMCRLHHGNNFHDHRCWDRVVISQVCMRLNYTSDGWQKPKDMPLGCAGTSELAFSRSCPGSASIGRGQVGDNPGCNFSNVDFTVRSLDDPHIAAMSMTKGTLNFGYTPHENFITGVVLLSIGLILLCPVAPVCWYWLMQKRSRHTTYLASDSIFQRPPTYDRTVTQSPAPSADSGATDDDYRVDIGKHSRLDTQSPRRRAPSKERPAPDGVSNADFYGVQPGGQVDLEMQQSVGEQVVNGVPVIREHPKSRARLY